MSVTVRELYCLVLCLPGPACATVLLCSWVVASESGFLARSGLESNVLLPDAPRDRTLDCVWTLK